MGVHRPPEGRSLKRKSQETLQSDESLTTYVWLFTFGAIWLAALSPLMENHTLLFTLQWVGVGVPLSQQAHCLLFPSWLFLVWRLNVYFHLFSIVSDWLSVWLLSLSVFPLNFFVVFLNVRLSGLSLVYNFTMCHNFSQGVSKVTWVMFKWEDQKQLNQTFGITWRSDSTHRVSQSINQSINLIYARYLTTFS